MNLWIHVEPKVLSEIPETLIIGGGEKINIFRGCKSRCFDCGDLDHIIWDSSRREKEKEQQQEESEKEKEKKEEEKKEEEKRET